MLALTFFTVFALPFLIGLKLFTGALLSKLLFIPYAKGIYLGSCTIVGISSSDGCGEGDGGIAVSYIGDYDSLSFTITSKKVAGITGSLKKLVYHKDNSSSYNQTGNRPSLNVFRYQQNAFMKFSSTDAAADAADEIKACCNMVAVHICNNGNVRVQGIEFTSSAKTAVKKSTQELKATVSDLTDVGGAESRIEITLISESKSNVIGNASVLTEAYLDALAA